MKLQATGTRFIVQRMESEMTSAGGIVLKTSDEHPRARVVSSGPKTTVTLVQGQQVLIDWSRAARIEFEKQEYWVVDQDNILASFG